MALTITSLLTNITLATNINNWTRSHTVAQATAITDSDFFRQGTESVAWQTKTTGPDHGMAYDSGASNINLSATFLRVWAQFNEANKYDTKLNGGVRVFVSDGAFGADNWGEWFVDGSDTLTADWRNYVIDTTMPFDRTSATAPTMTTIRRVGITTNMITKPAKVQNIHVDAIRYGRGLRITGTVAEVGKGWAEIAAADENVSNQYGVFQRAANGVLVLVGELIFNDSAGSGSVDFSDNQNEKIVIPKAFAGTLDGLPGIIIEGNATGTTDFQLGSVVGAGDDRQGILGGTIFSLQDKWAFDAETASANIDTCEIYGASFEGAGVAKFGGGTKEKVIGCSFINCDEFQPNNVENLNNNVIAPIPDRGYEFITTAIGKQINFVAGSTDDLPIAQALQIDVSATPDATVDLTVDINDFSANDVVCFPATEGAGDIFAVSSKQKYNKVKINTGTARSGGSLIWRYKTASGWTTFTPVTDGTNTLSTTGLQTVDLWATPPADWVASSLVVDSSIRKKEPLWFISLEVVTTMTTNPLVTQAFIADTVEHHAHFPDATKTNGYTADALKFFGHAPDGKPKWHGENSETKVTTTAGSFTVNQYYKIETVGSTDFTLIGSPNNTVGTVFKATGAGTGTGTASEVLFINATNGSNITANEVDNTGATPGNTSVSNAVTVEVNSVTEGTAVKVIAKATVGAVSAGDVLFQGLADSTGKISFSHNYEGNLSVRVVARNQGIPNAAIADDGGAFTDETAEANSFAVGDMTLMPATPVVGDAYYWAHDEPFDAIKLDISQAGVGSGALDWEYSIGGGVYQYLNAPFVADSSTYDSDSTNKLNHVVTLPADVKSGDVLILLFTCDADPTIIWPGSFTELFQTANGSLAKSGVAYRLANGSEGGTTVTVGLDSGENATAVVAAVRNGRQQAPDVATAVTGTSQFPNPPSLTPVPSNGVDNYLWLATSGSQGTLGTAPDVPANYSAIGIVDDGSVNGASSMLAFRVLKATSENPGVFDIDVTSPWIANTIAIQTPDVSSYFLDGTDSFKNVNENKVTWALRQDWADDTVNGQGPFKFIRARLDSGTYTTQPLGRKATLNTTRYLPFDQDRTITSTGLEVVASWVEDTISRF